MAAQQQTAKQRKCPHPAQHVHPTYDPRYEVCDLCHLVRLAPVLAPWIIVHDEQQPEPTPPPLFEMRSAPASIRDAAAADLATVESTVPTSPRRRSRRSSKEQTIIAEVAAIIARDNALLGFDPTEDAAELAAYGVEAFGLCPRCLRAARAEYADNLPAYETHTTRADKAARTA